MYVDPDIAMLLAAVDPEAPDLSDLTPAAARAVMYDVVAMARPPVDVATVVDIDVPTRAGSTPARLYRPESSMSGALVVYFHGGGWQVGSLDVSDRVMRRLAAESGMSVLSVDFRCAPEYRFPAAVDDCYDAFVWASGHLGDLGVDGSFVAVAGDSSGANLAGAVAQLSRDRSGPRIDHQLLASPVVTRDFTTASYQQFGTGYHLTRRMMETFWDRYIGGEGAPLYADLLAAPSLSGLPAATVLTCSLDVLRDEGESYAWALDAAGVEVTLIRVHGQIHGVWYLDGMSERSYQFGLDVAHALRRAYRPRHPRSGPR